MKKLSYQLYSSRNQPPFDQTCAMLAELGYAEVEGFGGVYQDPAATKAVLEANGLRMTSGHFPLEHLEKDAEACFALARQLEMQTLYCPYLAEEIRPTDAPGWQALGQRLGALRQTCSDAGFFFGYHNHDFELVPCADGSVPLDSLLEADEMLEWEADLAWVLQGKGDIAACVARHGARITAVHIKDIAPQGECTDEDGWADIGHGTMDWAQLLESMTNCPVRHYILEHDKPSDDRRFAQRSMDSLRQYAAIQD